MKKVRCAIYCRKSVEKGLDMEFNTLDAQREAGEAYVASQKANGWVCLPEHYDDGGFSGGNLNRPALKKLLADCEAGKVDVIVVYKIDRLSRSLCDFADLSRSFEKWNVAFVSVTQEINTQTSAGRMMLNILMTFAQFEREMIATRVKDKMAATRKKGKWVGGQIPFGYKVENKKLLVEPKNAAVVQRIFKRYLEIQSPTTIIRELAADGIVGTCGNPMDKAYINRILNNHLYIGEVVYDGAVYPGEHEAIIDRATWDTVQRFLRENNPRPDRSRDSTSEAALAGLVRCEHCHSAMVPVKSQRRGRVYPYYRCLRSMKADTDCPIKAVPAGEIEAIVLRQMKSVVQAPEVIAGVTKLTGLSTKTIHDTFKERFWAELTPAEKQRLMHLLVERVAINDDGVDIEFKTSEIKSVKEAYSEQESA